MFSKFAHTAQGFVHPHERIPQHTEVKIHGIGKGIHTTYHKNSSPTDHTNDSKNRDKSSETSSKTLTRRLKMLRTSSICSSVESASHTDSSSSLSADDLGTQDSIHCNAANMPNKITGEMGLQITLSQEDQHKIILKYNYDRHFRYIHPNVFAPACMSDVRRMGGGGSGVAVFCGTHPELGEIVMKHGGFNDMKELFALAKISSELKKRGGLATKNCDYASEAARFMVACLPEFKMVYISPQHLVFKEKAIWGKLRRLIKFGNLVSRISPSSNGKERHSTGTFASLVSKIQEERDNASSGSPMSPTLLSLDDSEFLSPGTSIRIYECDSGKATVYLDAKDRKKKPSLAFVLPKCRIKSIHQTAVELESSQAFDSLQNIYDGLQPMMSKHLFKFTLAQKRIGGHNAKTGNQWLYEGELYGLLLSNLISKFIKTIHNLEALTLPEEVDVVDEVRREVQQLNLSHIQADGLSAMADHFMGNSIKKNFDPKKGRIRLLRQTCEEFQEHLLHLEPEEELPAKHLGTLVKANACISDVFVGASTEPPRMHPNKDFWINLMTQAVSNRKGMSPNATKRIWTSGLADAGIHNLFVSPDDLYFFDLGVPQLQSLPGFMTKFLFSFFHVLGMQEGNDNEWVSRFIPEGDKLTLTVETRHLLSQAYDAFEVSLDRIIDEIFDGDHHLRWLLLQYVTLQLLSDAAFCLQRWNMKGGGRQRVNNHNEGLERWLWRALWDMFIAFDINTKESWQRLQVEHPSCEESSSSIKEGIRKSILSSKIDPNTLQDLMDAIDNEEKGNTDRRHSEPSKKLSEAIEPATRRRWSCRASRWPSERLNQSCLRELTAATFDYCSDIPTSKDSDDSISDDDSAINASTTLPPGIHLSEHSTGSLRSSRTRYSSMDDSLLEENEE